MKRASLALVLSLLAADSGWSHGGTYRGPLPGVPTPGGGSGPGGPSGPRGPGPGAPGGASPGPASGPAGPSPFTPRIPPPSLLPSTGASDEPLGLADWRIWWSYNHDALLDPRARLQGLVSSSGENPLVAGRRRLQEALLPVLVDKLGSGGKESVMRQCLIALARLTRVENLSVPLERWIEVYLSFDSPNLKEAALLALGIGGEAEAIEPLRHVLMDDEAGRVLLRSNGTISFRLRSFAAYSLGLLGNRSSSEDERRRIVHALLFALGHDGAIERELRIACALALGRVPIQPCRSEAEGQDPARQIEELHLCGGVQSEFLMAVARDKTLDPWFRGHAAAALGRLAHEAGAGLPAAGDHPAVASRADIVRTLVGLARESRGEPAVLHGCLLALGSTVDADADEVDVDARQLLLEATKRDAPTAQRFALLALAAALGRPGDGIEPDTAWKGGSELLLREFLRAKSAGSPWYALALAVTGQARTRLAEVVPTTFTYGLRTRLGQTKELDEAAALALALAVLRPSEPTFGAALLKAFERFPEPAFRANGAIALGFLGVRSAIPALEKALDEAGDSSPAVLSASLGLRLLGDPDIVPDFVKRITDAKGEAERAARVYVHALAFLQDPAGVEPLFALVSDESRDEDLRCAVVWCLGALANPHAPDWTAGYANGLDYHFLSWTLRSPLQDGRGLLDWR